MPISINNTTLTFNNGTTMTTAATGTVSSVATGNGLQGGTITTSGTLSIAAPGANTVGSYATIGNVSPGSFAFGSNYAAGTNSQQVQAATVANGGEIWITSAISGTWRWLGANTQNSSVMQCGLGVRVS